MYRLPALHVLAVAWLAASAVLAAGDGDKGRELAERYCKGCHVVAAENRLGGIGSTPSFFLMQEKLDNYRQRLFSLKQRRPHKAMARLEPLTPGDLEHLVAYIGTLRRPSALGRPAGRACDIKPIYGVDNAAK
jgi:mono/diheme cytochrome c family protein